MKTDYNKIKFVSMRHQTCILTEESFRDNPELERKGFKVGEYEVEGAVNSKYVIHNEEGIREAVLIFKSKFGRFLD